MSAKGPEQIRMLFRKNTIPSMYSVVGSSVNALTFWTSSVISATGCYGSSMYVFAGIKSMLSRVVISKVPKDDGAR